MSDLQTIVWCALSVVIASVVIFYLADDERERYEHEKWLRDTKRKKPALSATAAATGSRCKSVDQSGSGDASGEGGRE